MKNFFKSIYDNRVASLQPRTQGLISAHRHANRGYDPRYDIYILYILGYWDWRKLGLHWPPCSVSRRFTNLYIAHEVDISCKQCELHSKIFPPLHIITFTLTRHTVSSHYIIEDLEPTVVMTLTCYFRFIVVLVPSRMLCLRHILFCHLDPGLWLAVWIFGHFWWMIVIFFRVFNSKEIAKLWIEHLNGHQKVTDCPIYMLIKRLCITYYPSSSLSFSLSSSFPSSSLLESPL